MDKRVPSIETASHLRRRITPEQKSRYEQLRREMAAIAKGRTAREMKDAQDLESLREWMKRKRESMAILERKQEAEEAMELEDVEIDLSGRTDVRFPFINKQGRMFFQVDSGAGHALVNEEGDEIGDSEYAGIKNMEEFDGRVVFIGQKKTGSEYKQFVVDSERGESQQYDEIIGTHNRGGKLRFVAKRKEKYYEVVEGVERELILPDGTKRVVSSDEGIFFLVERDKKQIVVNEQKKKISGNYDVLEVYSIAGRFVMYARGFIFYQLLDVNGKQIGGFAAKTFHRYHGIGGGTKNIGGQIVFNIANEWGEHVVSEKKGKIGTYYQVKGIENVGGRIVILTEDKDVMLAVFDGDGRQIGERYASVDNIQNVGGKIAFIARENIGETFEQLIHEDKKVLSRARLLTSDRIMEVVEAGGTIYYSVKVSGGMTIVGEDGRERFAYSYSQISNLTAIGDKIIFAAQDSGIAPWTVVNEKGTKLCDEFDEIIQIKPCGGNKFYVFGRNGKKYSRKLCVV